MYGHETVSLKCKNIWDGGVGLNQFIGILTSLSSSVTALPCYVWKVFVVEKIKKKSGHTKSVITYLNGKFECTNTFSKCTFMIALGLSN